MKKALLAVFFMVVICSTVDANTVKVGISLFEPCVIKTDRGYTGHDIELWESVASQSGIEYEYVEIEFSKILDALESGAVDVAVAGITKTAEREERIDFSHHYLDSGLRVMVKSNGNKSLLSVFKGIFTPGLQRILALLLMFIVVAGHIVWWFERGKDSINDNYFPGIFEAFYWAIVTVSTVGYGDIAPKDWKGRVGTSIIILIGLAIFGMYVGEVSSSMTLSKMESDIQGVQDLKGKRVATIKGTTSEKILDALGATVYAGQTMEGGTYLLSRDKVDAVVFDSPAILYHAAKEDELYSVGEVFDKQYYAFAFQEDSDLREKINRSLLKILESPEYLRIYGRWFK